MWFVVGEDDRLVRWLSGDPQARRNAQCQSLAWTKRNDIFRRDNELQVAELDEVDTINELVLTRRSAVLRVGQSEVSSLE